MRVAGTSTLKVTSLAVSVKNTIVSPVPSGQAPDLPTWSSIKEKKKKKEKEGGKENI